MGKRKQGQFDNSPESWLEEFQKFCRERKLNWLDELFEETATYGKEKKKEDKTDNHSD